MSKLFIAFIFILLNPSKAADTVNVSCEFKIVSPGLVFIEGQQYECILQGDFPYIDGEVESVNGNHLEEKLDSDVTVLTINDKKLFEIPNLSTFTALKYINILKSSLKVLKRDNIANFKDTLEHLVVKNSNIEIVEEDVFSDMTKLITIDLRNNHIFYIETTQFSSLSFLKNFLLEGNECKNTNSDEDIKNIQISDTALNMAGFVQSISDSTCGTLNGEKLINYYQNLRLDNDLEGSKAEQNYAVLFDALTQRNKEFEDFEDEISENITSLTKLYQNSTSENEELQQKVTELQEKVSNLELDAEKCMEVNGTCRFTNDENFGYSCIAHNININSSGSTIEWSGEHTENAGNDNVNALIIRSLDVQFIPTKIGESFPKLKVLIIRDCGLKKLSKDDFVSLKELQELKIVGNDITSIDVGVFDGLTELKSLDLSDNGIKVLPSKIFAMLKALTSFNLSNNLLTTLKSDFLPSTTVIDSFLGMDNLLATVESNFVWKLRNAELIDFTGNRCDLKFDKVAGDLYFEFYNSILKKC